MNKSMHNHSGRLTGKVAVITGAASGIGLATAVRFASEGAALLLADLNEQGGHDAAERCRAAGADTIFVQTDVAEENAVKRMIATAVQRFSRIDILFSNAGSPGALGPIENVAVEDWDRSLGILLRSVFLGIKHVAPIMTAQGAGVIINTSSIAGLGGYPFGHAYGAAKAAIINLTRSTALQLGPEGVRVNCVCPGDVLTPMVGTDLEAVGEKLRERQPTGRAGRPDDIASAVLYLASDEAEWISGTALIVDGGATAGIWSFSAPDPAHKQAVFVGPSFQRVT